MHDKVSADMESRAFIRKGISNRVLWQVNGAGFISQTTSLQKQSLPETEASCYQFDHSAGSGQSQLNIILMFPGHQS